MTKNNDTTNNPLFEDENGDVHIDLETLRIQMQQEQEEEDKRKKAEEAAAAEAETQRIKDVRAQGLQVIDDANGDIDDQLERAARSLIVVEQTNEAKANQAHKRNNRLRKRLAQEPLHLVERWLDENLDEVISDPGIGDGVLDDVIEKRDELQDLLADRDETIEAQTEQLEAARTRITELDDQVAAGQPCDHEAELLLKDSRINALEDEVEKLKGSDNRNLYPANDELRRQNAKLEQQVNDLQKELAATEQRAANATAKAEKASKPPRFGLKALADKATRVETVPAISAVTKTK